MTKRLRGVDKTKKAGKHCFRTQRRRTWPIGVLLFPLPAHTEEGVNVAEQDDGRWEDRLLMVNHNEVVALVLPHQIRNGLDLNIHIAGKQSTRTVAMMVVKRTMRTYR